MRHAGHLFAFQGDLTRVACDAWLLPSDKRLKVVRRHWCRSSLSQAKYVQPNPTQNHTP